MRDAFILIHYSLWSERSTADVTPQGEKLSRNVCMLARGGIKIEEKCKVASKTTSCLIVSRKKEEKSHFINRHK